MKNTFLYILAGCFWGITSGRTEEMRVSLGWTAYPEPSQEGWSVSMPVEVLVGSFWSKAETIPLLDKATGRETFSVKHGSGTWKLTLTGFDPKDNVRLDLLFIRNGDGKRLVTVSGPDGKKWADKVNVGDDGKGLVVQAGPWTGKESYTVTIEPVGKGWSCLPNVVRVRR